MMTRTEIRRFLGNVLVGWLVLGAVSTTAATAYKVDMTVTRNGDVVAEPSAVIEQNRQADLTIENSDAPVRLLLTATEGPAVAAGRPTVELKLLFLTRSGEKWLLQAEPSTALYLGQEASLTVDSAIDRTTKDAYEIRLIVDRFDPASATAMPQGAPLGLLQDDAGCVSPASTSLLSMLASAVGISSAHAQPGGACCSVTNLSYCNVVWCCNTVNNHRVCCYPP